MVNVIFFMWGFLSPLEIFPRKRFEAGEAVFSVLNCPCFFYGFVNIILFWFFFFSYLFLNESYLLRQYLSWEVKLTCKIS